MKDEDWEELNLEARAAIILCLGPLKEMSHSLSMKKQRYWCVVKVRDQVHDEESNELNLSKIQIVGMQDGGRQLNSRLCQQV